MHEQRIAESTFSVLLAEYVNALTGDVRASDAADVFIARIQAEHPDVLDEWIAVHLHRFVRSDISRHLQSRRARAFRDAQARARGEAVENGTRTRLIDEPFVIDDNATRRPLRHMTHTDRLYAARRYEESSRRERLRAKFLREIDRIAGDRLTGEAMDADAVDNIYAAIFGDVPVTA
jgi:hypothetical protein